jgi:putative hydrolase of the HAD superfamily
MRAALFDLDDTLYREMDYVHSGFRAVSRFLSHRFALCDQSVFDLMVSALAREGRGHVFDIALRELGIEGRMDPRLLIYTYRTHTPSIQLAPQAAQCLCNLRHRGWRLGLVTDGMGSIQRRKIDALGLEPLVDVIVCTDEIGADFWKPSTVPFEVALECLMIRPEKAAYLADNPQKDFLGPNRLGMMTIQINTYLNDLARTPAQDASRASLEAQNLVEAEEILERIQP